jgi:hypothetical protein
MTTSGAIIAVICGMMSIAGGRIDFPTDGGEKEIERLNHWFIEAMNQ